jgi:hypothetical protein
MRTITIVVIIINYIYSFTSTLLAYWTSSFNDQTIGLWAISLRKTQDAENFHINRMSLWVPPSDAGVRVLWYMKQDISSALFRELSLEEAMDLSQDRLLLQLDITCLRDVFWYTYVHLLKELLAQFSFPEIRSVLTFISSPVFVSFWMRFCYSFIQRNVVAATFSFFLYFIYNQNFTFITRYF